MEKPKAIQRKLLIEYKKTLTLSQKLFEIGVGTLLGDASIQTQDRGKTYRLKFQQSDNFHRDYIFHLHRQFDEWVLSKQPHFDEKRKMWSFQTVSHCEFKKLAHIFVLDSQGTMCKKHVKPDLIQQYLTPLGFAYWIMDDGGKSCYNKDYERKGFALNTHGFSKPQVDLLCQGLIDRYDLDCWVKPNKNKWVIVISGHDHKKMMSLIQKWIIPSMYHKIPGLSQ